MLARAFYLMLAGAFGGFLAWAVSEPFAPSTFMDEAWSRHESVLGLVAGALIGGFVGGFSGWRQGSRLHFLRGAGVGIVAGGVAGTAGIHLGSSVMNAIASPLQAVTGAGATLTFVGRCLGWGVFGGLIGCAVGLAEGIIGQSSSRLYQGTLGGVIGGLLGGAMFEISGRIFNSMTLTLQGAAAGQVHETGMIPRAVGLVATGAGIGLLIGIVEALGRKAWVRVIYGRNEGKEYLIDVPQAFLGRSESAHVPIFGDVNIMPMHAMIQKHGSNYLLVDGGSPMGTGLNGNRIQQAQLNSGDMIQIGTFNIQFMLRSGRVAVPAEVYGHGAIPLQPQTAPAPFSPTQQTTVMAPMSNQTVMQQPTAVAAMTLVATSGPLAGQRFEIMNPTELGRESGKIPLGFDNNVSRRHASVSPIPGGLSFTDLGSTNGSKVNGVKTQAAQLRKGDTLEIGITTFKVE